MKEKIKNLLLEKRRYDLEEKITFIEKIKLFFNYPIQKIIGYVELNQTVIKINKKVLIPRYETEELILVANDLIQKNNYKKILDLGCGSGFIGISIKKKFQENIVVFQSDVDQKAIKQTKINSKINKVKTIIIKSNMFNNLNNKKFDLIVSNPPYLLKKDKKFISKSVLWYEPHRALFAKNNGLYFYKIIENNLEKFLNKNGTILVEINPINVDWFIKNNYQVLKDINNKFRFAFKVNK